MNNTISSGNMRIIIKFVYNLINILNIRSAFEGHQSFNVDFLTNKNTI